MANTLNLTNICSQRRQQMLFNIPLSRNELQPSPYVSSSGQPAYTKAQLDMRRKAEILKYTSNKSSGQTNNTTRKEKFAQIARARYEGNVLFCPQDISIPTLTSACDVPGPIIYLVNDKSVPLYNYATNTDSKGVTNVTNNNFFSNIFIDNKSVFSNTQSIVTSLYIQNNNNISIRSFNINSPFGLYITGNNIPPTGPFNITIEITAITTIPYYSGSQVLTIGGIPNYSYSIQRTPIRLTLTPPTSTENFNYSAFINLGNLLLSNINLYTQNGYIYDIKTQFSYTFDSGNSSIINNSNAILYMNLSSEFYQSIKQDINPLSGTTVANNCIINSGISLDTYQPTSLFV